MSIILNENLPPPHFPIKHSGKNKTKKKPNQASQVLSVCDSHLKAGPFEFCPAELALTQRRAGSNLCSHWKVASDDFILPMTERGSLHFNTIFKNKNKNKQRFPVNRRFVRKLNHMILGQWGLLRETTYCTSRCRPALHCHKTTPKTEMEV